MSETPAGEHSADYDAWPCDDYKAPITCWTVPSGHKQIVCEGCRAAFPNGPEVQKLYAATPPVAYRWTTSGGEVFVIDPREIVSVIASDGSTDA